MGSKTTSFNLLVSLQGEVIQGRGRIAEHMTRLIGYASCLVSSLILQTWFDMHDSVMLKASD